jgi:hypothetical protein
MHDLGMPAEGLLGAARLAHSLRSGPPSRTPAFNVAARRCRTLLVFLSGVRIEVDDRRETYCLYRTFVGICRLRDYSALRASPTRFARGRRRYAPAFNVAARRCRTRHFFCRGFELRTFGSTCEAASLYRVAGYAG